MTSTHGSATPKGGCGPGWACPSSGCWRCTSRCAPAPSSSGCCRPCSDSITEKPQSDEGSKDETKSLSAFQAFVISAAARVGTGNVSGVRRVRSSSAVPAPSCGCGSCASSPPRRASSSRRSPSCGRCAPTTPTRAGPPCYIHRGLGSRGFGAFFALLFIFCFALAFTSLQANTITDAVSGAVGAYADPESMPWLPIVIGVVLALLTAGIVIGGMRRVANVAQSMVPIMAAIYLLVGIIVVGLNFGEMPSPRPDVRGRLQPAGRDRRRHRRCDRQRRAARNALQRGGDGLGAERRRDRVGEPPGEAGSRPDAGRRTSTRSSSARSPRSSCSWRSRTRRPAARASSWSRSRSTASLGAWSAILLGAIHAAARVHIRAGQLLLRRGERPLPHVEARLAPGLRSVRRRDGVHRLRHLRGARRGPSPGCRWS